MSGRRRTPASNDTLWMLLAFGVIVLIGISVLTGFLDENAWVRWIVFSVFIGIFVYCAQFFPGAFYNYYIQYPVTKKLDAKLPTSLVGAIFNIYFVKVQTDFFRIWWQSGSWLVDVFNNLILLYVIILAIRLILKIVKHRRDNRGII